MRLRFLLGLSILASCSAALWPAPVRADDAPKGYACEFNQGTSGIYENGAFSSKPPAAIKFAIVGIDLEKQSAALHGEGGAVNGKLSIARAIGANHFLEIATEGYWNITTIYDADTKTGLSPAVHSRHSGVVGQPLIAQYTGSCRAMP